MKAIDHSKITHIDATKDGVLRCYIGKRLYAVLRDEAAEALGDAMRAEQGQLALQAESVA